MTYDLCMNAIYIFWHPTLASIVSNSCHLVLQQEPCQCAWGQAQNRPMRHAKILTELTLVHALVAHHIPPSSDIIRASTSRNVL